MRTSYASGGGKRKAANAAKWRVRTIAAHIGPRGLPSLTRASLAALGYVIVAPDDAAGKGSEPDLRLVDERQLARVPSPGDDSAPIVLLTGARSSFVEDDRIIGRVVKPASIDSLYPLLQQALEDTPRRAPRIRSNLAGRCIREDRRWPCALVSLSETGCLIQSSEPIGLEEGSRINLQFALPREGIVFARAECRRREGTRVGLAFSEAEGETLERISRYVASQLST